MTTGEKLSKLRKELGYTQEALAEIIGVSRQSISKWESDGAFPETEKLIQLSRLYKCSIDYLLKDEVEEEKSVPINNIDNNKHKLSNYLSKNLFTCLWSVLIFGITLLFYLFPYASKEVITNGIYLGYIKSNIYDILSASFYEIGNIIVLIALLSQILMMILGILIYCKNDKRFFTIRNILAVIETSIWLYLLISILSITTFQIGMAFMLLSSLGNLIGLNFIKFNKYNEKKVISKNYSIYYSIIIFILTLIIYFIEENNQFGDNMYNVYVYMFSFHDWISYSILLATIFSVMLLVFGIIFSKKRIKTIYNWRLIVSSIILVFWLLLFLLYINLSSILMFIISLCNLLGILLIKDNKVEVMYE